MSGNGREIAGLMKQREEELRKAAEESRARAEAHRRQTTEDLQQQEQHYKLLLGGLGNVTRYDIDEPVDSPSPRWPVRDSARPVTPKRTPSRGVKKKVKAVPKPAPKPDLKKKKPQLPAAAKQNIMHLHVAQADPVDPSREQNREILQRLEDMEKLSAVMAAQLTKQNRHEEEERVEEEQRFLRLEEDNMMLREQISTLLRCHPLVTGVKSPSQQPVIHQVPMLPRNPSPPVHTSIPPPPPPPPPPMTPAQSYPAVLLKPALRALEDLEEAGRDRLEDISAVVLKGIRSSSKEVMYRLRRLESVAETAEESLSALEKRVRSVADVNRQHGEAYQKAAVEIERLRQELAARDNIIKEQGGFIQALQAGTMSPPAMYSPVGRMAPIGSPSPPNPPRESGSGGGGGERGKSKSSKKRSPSPSTGAQQRRKNASSPSPDRFASASPADERRLLHERMRQTEEEEMQIELQNKALREELERVRQKMAGRQGDPLPFAGTRMPEFSPSPQRSIGRVPI